MSIFRLNNTFDLVEKILYRTNDDKIFYIKQAINNFFINNHEYMELFSYDELLTYMLSDKKEHDKSVSHVIDMITLELINIKSKAIFDMAVEQYGIKLWNGRAWRNKTCQRKCPFADWCNGKKVQIDNEQLCRGQLYMKKLSKNDITNLIINDRIKIINADGTIYIDNFKIFDSTYEEIFYNFFLYIPEILDIGWSKSKRKVYGENIIRLLYNKAKNEKD